MRRVWLLAVGTFAVGTDLFVLAGILPVMAGALGVSEAAAGQSTTVFSVVYAIATPILAAATAPLAPKRVLPTALAVFTLGNVATALSVSLPMLLATRVVAALGAAAFTPAALGAATRLVGPARRGRALAVVMGGLNGAIGLGVPLGTLLAQVAGWRAAMWLVVVLGLAGLTLAPRAVADLAGTPGTPSGSSVVARMSLLGRPRILATLAVTALAVTGGIIAYTYIASTVAATTGVAGTALSVVLVLYGLGALGGVLAAGVVSDHLGPARTVAAALALQVLVLAVVPLVGSFVLIGLLAVAWGASLTAFTPPQQHLLVDAAPDRATVAVSVNSSATYLGQAAGAGLGGMALVHLTSAALLPWVAAVPAVAALVVHLLTRRGRSTVPEPTVALDRRSTT